MSINELFEKDRERWLKVKFLDTEKCIKAFVPAFISSADDLIKGQGYEVLSISVNEEHLPQVAALVEMKMNVLGRLSHHVPDKVVADLVDLFNSKIEEVKQYTSKDLSKFKQ